MQFCAVAGRTSVKVSLRAGHSNRKLQVCPRSAHPSFLIAAVPTHLTVSCALSPPAQAAPTHDARRTTHDARCFTSSLHPLHPTCSASRQHVERVARWRVQKSHEPRLSHAAPPPFWHAQLLLSPRHSLSRCCAALRDCLLTPCSSSGSALPLAPSRYAQSTRSLQHLADAGTHAQPTHMLSAPRAQRVAMDTNAPPLALPHASPQPASTALTAAASPPHPRAVPQPGRPSRTDNLAGTARGGLSFALCENRIFPNLTRKRPVFSMSSRK